MEWILCISQWHKFFVLETYSALVYWQVLCCWCEELYGHIVCSLVNSTNIIRCRQNFWLSCASNNKSPSMQWCNLYDKNLVLDASATQSHHTRQSNNICIQLGTSFKSFGYHKQPVEDLPLLPFYMFGNHVRTHHIWNTQLATLMGQRVDFDIGILVILNSLLLDSCRRRLCFFIMINFVYDNRNQRLLCTKAAVA